MSQPSSRPNGEAASAAADQHEKIQQGNLSRSLKSRHLSMIAIGGAIGTGLFFASGSAVHTGGPGGALLAYAMMGFMVYCMMTSLGEMCTCLPVSGSFEAYANRFLDPAMGFALGWTYWFSWASTVAAELVAGALIVKYWFPDTPATIWAALFLIILLALNVITVKAFGEAEFWFAGIKVCVVVVFLIVGVLMISGILKGNACGFSNWHLKAPDGRQAPFAGGMGMILNVFLVAGFSFQGTEMVGMSAAESENPERDVPKAIKSVFWRILIFYIGCIIVIGTLIPFTDPHLLSADIDNVAASPFTLVFKNAGLAVAASVMNAVILTSVLSCGNSGLYCSSRMLYAMGQSGKAPRFFGKVTKGGVPLYAILATAAIGALAFLASLVGEGKVYIMLYNATSIAGFFTWFGISLCHYRFRKAYVAQGHKVEDLPYRSPFYPFGPIFATILSVVVILGSNIWIFQATTFSWFDFVTNYALVPVFILMVVIYKIVRKTKIVPLMECDFSVPEELQRHREERAEEAGQRR